VPIHEGDSSALLTFLIDGTITGESVPHEEFNDWKPAEKGTADRVVLPRRSHLDLLGIHASYGLGMSGAEAEISLACLMRWSPEDVLHSFIMWAIMMVAMMFPSATPMILMFTFVNQQQGANQRPRVPTGLFGLGYLLVWTAYSALATMA
jgi:hypothetical protein